MRRGRAPCAGPRPTAIPLCLYSDGASGATRWARRTHRGTAVEVSRFRREATGCFRSARCIGGSARQVLVRAAWPRSDVLEYRRPGPRHPFRRARVPKTGPRHPFRRTRAPKTGPRHPFRRTRVPKNRSSAPFPTCSSTENRSPAPFPTYSSTEKQVLYVLSDVLEHRKQVPGTLSDVLEYRKTGPRHPFRRTRAPKTGPRHPFRRTRVPKNRSSTSFPRRWRSERVRLLSRRNAMLQRNGIA